MKDEKRDEFDAIRDKVQEINRLFGGKLNVKEWDSGGHRVFKVVMQWSVRKPERENYFYRIA